MGITQLKQRQITALGFLQQGLAQGMATARFKAGSQLHQPIGIKISQGLHGRNQGTPQGEGAGFIEQHGLEPGRGFNRITTAKQQTLPGSPARAHRDGGGGS